MISGKTNDDLYEDGEFLNLIAQEVGKSGEIGWYKVGWYLGIKEEKLNELRFVYNPTENKAAKAKECLRIWIRAVKGGPVLDHLVYALRKAGLTYLKNIVSSLKGSTGPADRTDDGIKATYVSFGLFNELFS